MAFRASGVATKPQIVVYYGFVNGRGRPRSELWDGSDDALRRHHDLPGILRQHPGARVAEEGDGEREGINNPFSQIENVFVLYANRT